MSNIQHDILDKLKEDKTEVKLYLTNGFQLKGNIEGFDNFTILLNSKEEGYKLIFKHAISTLDPQGEVELE